MKLKRINNLLRKKQCNLIGIWSQSEVVKVESKEENEESTKEELKTHMVQFLHDCAKWTRRGICAIS